METFLDYIAAILYNIDISEVNPKECTEKGYYEWITSRDDIHEIIALWLKTKRIGIKHPIKDAGKANYFREEGNKFFKEKNYIESVRAYTESAKYATFDGNDFSIAIANRSASFFHLRRYEASLSDIELATSIGYPEESLWKLYLRAAECHLGLKKKKLAEKELEKLYKWIEKNKDLNYSMKNAIEKRAQDLSSKVSKSPELKEDSSTILKTIANPADLLPKNIKYPFASESVIRKTSASRGRCVYANKSIKKGEVLFSEKPFAWCPKIQGHDMSLCAHCCGFMDDSLIPCRGCVDILYCSRKCWNDAWPYHQWECAGYSLNLWQEFDIGHMALKILLVSMTSSDLARFNEMHRLVTNIDKKTKRDILILCIGSLMVTTYIERYTDFFQRVDIKKSLVDKFDDPDLSFNVDLSTIQGQKLYIGSMILRHSLQMHGNSWYITTCGEVDKSSTGRIVLKKDQQYGMAVYPSASMVNHSCSPSLTVSFWRNWLILKAEKDIPEGQEICVSYGPDYRRMSKSERQAELLKKYSFECQCEACTDPVLQSYADRFRGLKCPKCSGPSQRLPDTNNYRCYDCLAEGTITFDDDLQEAFELFYKGMKNVNVRKYKEAIPYFKECLAIRKKYLYQYNEDVGKTMDMLGQCYTANGDLLGSISYLEQNLAIVEKRYGPISLELADEMTKITGVCNAYLRIGNIRGMAEYKNIVEKIRKYLNRSQAIISICTGPWNDYYQEITREKGNFSALFGKLRF